MKKLRFRDDGSFTIVQFTDLHWKNSDEQDCLTNALMELVIREERPDLIVFTGDLIDSTHCRDPIQSLRDAVRTADQSGIPWAAVFGNHDSESSVTREELHQVLTEFENGLTGHTPGIIGYGNYTLTVEGEEGENAALLYFLDSGEYSRLPHVEGYGWMSPDQIDWYRNEAKSYREQNNGQRLPALAFFHIPLPEYKTVWEIGSCRGNKFEEVCCPKLNTGFFAAMVESGDVIAAFAGHDHTNDYYGTLHGILLGYGRATGYNTYGKEGFARGARVIRMQEGNRDLTTWLRLADGTVDYQTMPQ